MTMLLPKGVSVLEQSASVVLTQEADGCSSGDQVLTINTADAGGGNYIVLETERWAIDKEDIDKFAALLKRVLEASDRIVGES